MNKIFKRVAALVIVALYYITSSSVGMRSKKEIGDIALVKSAQVEITNEKQ
jgi:hypothetical protein